MTYAVIDDYKNIVIDSNYCHEFSAYFIKRNSEMSRTCTCFLTIGIMLSFPLNDESIHVLANSCFVVTPAEGGWKRINTKFKH